MGDATVNLGKIEDTFDSYPYTIKTIGTNYLGKVYWDGGIITFNSSSSCNLDMYADKNHVWRCKYDNVVKISDKLLDNSGKEISKKEIWKEYYR